MSWMLAFWSTPARTLLSCSIRTINTRLCSWIRQSDFGSMHLSACPHWRSILPDAVLSRSFLDQSAAQHGLRIGRAADNSRLYCGAPWTLPQALLQLPSPATQAAGFAAPQGGQVRCSPDERFPIWRLGGHPVAALAIHGYHLGVEDGEIYVPAAKKLLRPNCICSALTFSFRMATCHCSAQFLHRLQS